MVDELDDEELCSIGRKILGDLHEGLQEKVGASWANAGSVHEVQS